MVSNEIASAPWSSISASSSRPTSRSVRPGRRPPRSTRSVSAASAASQASRSSATSPASLISRSASTVPAARTSSVSALRSVSSLDSASKPSTVTTWLSKPSLPTPAAAARPTRWRPQRPLDRDLQVGRLLGGLGAVPAVGGQHGPAIVGEHQQRGVRPGETGQVAHVDQVRDQHRVQPAGGDLRTEIVSTLGMCHDSRRYSLRWCPMTNWMLRGLVFAAAMVVVRLFQGALINAWQTQAGIDQHRAAASVPRRRRRMGGAGRPRRRHGQPDPDRRDDLAMTWLLAGLVAGVLSGAVSWLISLFYSGAVHRRPDQRGDDVRGLHRAVCFPARDHRCGRRPLAGRPAVREGAREAPRPWR